MPNQAKTSVGFIILTHANLDRTADLIKMILSSDNTFVSLHIDQTADMDELSSFRDALKSDLGVRVFEAERVHCEWGSFSLVRATLNCAKQLLTERPDLSHIVLLSGSDVPVRPISELQDFLAKHPKRNFIQSVAADAGWVRGGLGEERATLYFPFSYIRQRRIFDIFVEVQRIASVSRKLPTKAKYHMGSQWWCLTADAVSKIVNAPQAQKYERYFEKTWIPDEGYFQTLIREVAKDENITSETLTYYRFDHDGRPYVFYDDHIHELENMESFFIRKVSPNATKIYEWARQISAQKPRKDIKRSNQPIDLSISDTEARRRRRDDARSLTGSYDKSADKKFRRHTVIFGFEESIVRKFMRSVICADAHVVHEMPFCSWHIDLDRSHVDDLPYTKYDLAIRNHAPLKFLKRILSVGKKPPLFGMTPSQNFYVEQNLWQSNSSEFVILRNSWVLSLVKFVKYNKLTLEHVAHREQILEKATELYEAEVSYCRHLSRLGHQPLILDLMHKSKEWVHSLNRFGVMTQPSALEGIDLIKLNDEGASEELKLIDFINAYGFRFSSHNINSAH